MDKGEFDTAHEEHNIEAGNAVLQPATIEDVKLSAGCNATRN